MKRRGPRLAGLPLLPAAILVAATLYSSTGQSFKHVAIGDTLKNPTLPTLDGKQATLLRADRKVSVFMFLRPDQEYSKYVLDEMARCEHEFEGKSVAWVAIVSDYYPKTVVQPLVDEAGFKSPVLIDAGDTLYGDLGVILQPVVGIADGKLKLVAYQPFAKVNFCNVIRARILFQLGEISQAELDRAINPPKAELGGENEVAQRNLRFAEMMYKSKKYDVASERLQKCLEHDPKHAPCHALLGAIAADQGQCDVAKPALQKALELDPANQVALEAKKRCP